MEIFDPDFTVDDFTTDLQKDLLEYWNSIRGDKSIPSRKDFNPADIPHILPIIVMVDVHPDPLRFRVRLWGTENVRFSGKDVTGFWLHEHNFVDKIEERYKWMVEKRKPYYVQTSMEWSLRDYDKYTSLALPFSSDGENVDIILSANHYF